MFQKKLVLQAVYKDEIWKVHRSYTYDYKYLPKYAFQVTRQQKALAGSDFGFDIPLHIGTIELFEMFLSTFILEKINIFELEFEYIHPDIKLKIIEILRTAIASGKLDEAEIFYLESWFFQLQMAPETITKPSLYFDLKFSKEITKYINN